MWGPQFGLGLSRHNSAPTSRRRVDTGAAMIQLNARFVLYDSTGLAVYFRCYQSIPTLSSRFRQLGLSLKTLNASMVICHDRRWSCHGSNTERGPPDPSHEWVVKSLHHHPGTGVRANHILWKLRRVFEADLVLQQAESLNVDETILRICTRFRKAACLRCDFDCCGSLTSGMFYEPRFIIILRSRLRQIQFWCCGYLLGGITGDSTLGGSFESSMRRSHLDS